MSANLLIRVFRLFGRKRRVINELPVLTLNEFGSMRLMVFPTASFMVEPDYANFTYKNKKSNQNENLYSKAINNWIMRGS
mgnify:CR=1 FL=1